MTESPSRSPSFAGDLGLLLREHRREAGLTQEELAERAGISTRAVSDIERGLRTTIYRDTANRIATALGLDPSRREDFAAASRRKTPFTESAPALPPRPPTQLRGRADHLERLIGLLAPGRLVTLTGPAGVGKTRLALEAAYRFAESLPTVGYIPLAPVVDAAALPSATLRALALPDSGDHRRLLARKLQSGALLVFDNFEHLSDGAWWINELAASVVGVRILVTSRAPLRLQMEQELPLPALDDADALELFRDRARALRPDLHWDDGQVEVARQVCRRLDRLPLGLELAAAALRHLTLPSLAARLESDLQPLEGGWRDQPARHQSMEAAIAWSVQLLDAAERSLLRALSVFAGSFGTDAVAAVAELEEAVVRRRIARLVDQNLVQTAGDVGGRPRYQLLEVVRQFGRAELTPDLRARHLDHFLALAEAAEPELHQARRSAWHERLSADADNLAAALGFAVEREDADRGLRLATALWRWWRQRGDFNEGRTQLRRLLALPGSSPAVRARALWGGYWLALHQLDHGEARSLCSELLELSEALDDRLARRNALTGLGMADLFEGAYEEALPLFTEALELARAAGDRWILATSTFNLAHALVDAGRRDEGAALLEQARRIYVAVGDTAFAERMRLYLARTSIVGGDLGTAARLLLEATEAFSSLGEAWGQVECLEVGGAVLAGLGRDQAAAAALGAAAAAHERLGTAELPPDAALLAPFVEAARVRAGPAWEEGLAQGAQLPIGDAIAEMVDALSAGAWPPSPR